MMNLAGTHSAGCPSLLPHNLAGTHSAGCPSL